MSVTITESQLQKVLHRPGYGIKGEKPRAPHLRSNVRSAPKECKETAKRSKTRESTERGTISYESADIAGAQKRIVDILPGFTPSPGMLFRMKENAGGLFLPIKSMGYVRRRANDSFLFKKPSHSLTASQRSYVSAMKRYNAYRDELRRLWRAGGLALPSCGVRLWFFQDMYKSWPEEQKAEMIGTPNERKPDTDNLVKAFYDALMEEDSAVWHLDNPCKFWADASFIEITFTTPPLYPVIRI